MGKSLRRRRQIPEGVSLSLSLFECERHGERRRAWGGSKTKPGFVGPRWHALTVGPIQRRVDEVAICDSSRRVRVFH